jgi:16S rRNA (uracil1498-N3)-methyltransferase
MKHSPRFVILDHAGGYGPARTVRVTGRELHHMRDVMRLGPGAEVTLYGASGLEYTGHIACFERDAALVMLAATPLARERPVPSLILAVGMIKAARMDLLVEKAAELGAAEFWPVLCARSVVREPGPERRERWRRISLAAVKQSLRPDTMVIHEPVDVAAIVRRAPKAALGVTCIDGAQPLSALMRCKGNDLKAANPVILAVGPEGDFTAEELTVLRDAGFVAAGLGHNRLRSETAGLAALSIAMGIFSELNNRTAGLKPRKASCLSNAHHQIFK